jgi:hypothetical protein
MMTVDLPVEMAVLRIVQINADYRIFGSPFGFFCVILLT